MLFITFAYKFSYSISTHNVNPISLNRPGSFFWPPTHPPLSGSYRHPLHLAELLYATFPTISIRPNKYYFAHKFVLWVRPEPNILPIFAISVAALLSINSKQKFTHCSAISPPFQAFAKSTLPSTSGLWASDLTGFYGSKIYRGFRLGLAPAGLDDLNKFIFLGHVSVALQIIEFLIHPHWRFLLPDIHRLTNILQRRNCVWIHVDWQVIRRLFHQTTVVDSPNNKNRVIFYRNPEIVSRLVPHPMRLDLNPSHKLIIQNMHIIKTICQPCRKHIIIPAPDDDHHEFLWQVHHFMWMPLHRRLAVRLKFHVLYLPVSKFQLP